MTALGTYTANRITPAMPVNPFGSTTLGSTDAPTTTTRANTGFDPAPAVLAPSTALDTARRSVSARFGSEMGNDFAAAAGGGAVSDALQNGVAKLAAFAQNGMKNIENAIQGDMDANSGQVDPAKMQQYTMRMSSYEMMMQLAAKIQEKQNNSIQAWLR